MILRILYKVFPWLVCVREGHKFVGRERMGPHLNNPEKGSEGGVYYGLRYAIKCDRCQAKPSPSQNH